MYSTIRRLLFILAVFAIAITATRWYSYAQDRPIVLTAAILSTNREALNSDAIKDFEEANPGISLRVRISDTKIPSPTRGLGPHLTAIQHYVSTADVVLVDSSQATVEATLSGYFLDLSPLIAADTKLNVPDFYPAVWRAFQWNGGNWALPVSADAYVLSYLPSAFDKAQITYPTDRWTLDDLVAAVRKLAIKDSSGRVSVPGIDVPGELEKAFLIRSLLGNNVVDGTVTPNAPKFSQPNVEQLLDTWAKLEAEGYIGHGDGKPGEFSAPISVIFADDVLLQREVSPEQKRVPVLFPGGKGGLDVLGAAVSAGTRHPEQAYALARFLTTRVEFVSESEYIDSSGARKSVTQTEAGLREDLPPNLVQLIEQVYNDGITTADLRYMNYLLSALGKATLANAPVQPAIVAAEAQAVADMKAAVSKRPTTVVNVATPIPVLAPNSGKIVLKFGITPSGDSMTRLDQWYALAADFGSKDPLVGQVSIDQGGSTLTASANRFDCFYMPYNAVPDADLRKILNLSPLVDSDSALDKGDFVGKTLNQLTRDNKLWALPIQLEPAVLMHDTQAFKQLGIPVTNNTWQLDTFTNALKALRTDPKGPAPFVPFAQSQDGTSLLMLIAAYGGVPVDYRTNPPRIDFTAPATVTAIQQVLDLGKQGYMQYTPFGPVTKEDDAPGPTRGTKLYADILNANSFQLLASTPYKPILYPRGTQFSAVSYSIGSAYISAKAQNPEACYRWISAVSRRPELLDAMPARRSLITNPTLAASQGPELVAFYTQINALLQDPATIPIDSQLGKKASPAAFLLQYWLYSAFDNYVLKGGDLAGGLKIAETNTRALQGCIASLPPYDVSSEASQLAYIRQFNECATKIDPALKPYFDSFGR